LNAAIAPEFVAADDARLFAVLRRPAGTAAGAVLIVPPLAEEMNKTRRLASLLADRLAARGVASISFDLSGTGDSSGEFAQATWRNWLRDVQVIAAWAGARGVPVTSVLGTRAGCLLAAAWQVESRATLRQVVCWQPVVDGARYVDQILRSRVAASLSGAGPREHAAGLRQMLARDGRLEIGGYEWPAGLLHDLEVLKLAPLYAQSSAPIDWVEVPRGEDAPLQPAYAQATEQLRQAGRQVRVTRVAAEPFWTSVEVVAPPALVDATAQLIAEAA
jgi:exosortase A-associated hydrolase 2